MDICDDTTLDTDADDDVSFYSRLLRHRLPFWQIVTIYLIGFIAVSFAMFAVIQVSTMHTVTIDQPALAPMPSAVSAAQQAGATTLNGSAIAYTDTAYYKDSACRQDGIAQEVPCGDNPSDGDGSGFGFGNWLSSAPVGYLISIAAVALLAIRFVCVYISGKRQLRDNIRKNTP